jgi:hypothetical protein
MSADPVPWRCTPAAVRWLGPRQLRQSCGAERGTHQHVRHPAIQQGAPAGPRIVACLPIPGTDPPAFARPAGGGLPRPDRLGHARPGAAGAGGKGGLAARPVLPDQPVHRRPQQVGMPVVPPVLPDQADHDPAQAGGLTAGVSAPAQPPQAAVGQRLGDQQAGAGHRVPPARMQLLGAMPTRGRGGTSWGACCGRSSMVTCSAVARVSRSASTGPFGLDVGSQRRSWAPSAHPPPLGIDRLGPGRPARV